ncbi:MAG: hypothetical protein EOP88_13280 [Verrucomicrobiaceae bacterium]|nr:MAG: hypothetical protein EOP88_13280 [Verrucomicrobiaceae bacterium]
MRSSYRTDLLPDALSPPPAIFHLALTPANLAALKRMVGRDGLDEKSITHIKGYSGNQGLFWFHGFCDEGDQTLACSRFVDDSTIGKLEAKLHVKAEKKFGELKSDRERTEELEQFLNAMRRYRADSE